MKINNQPKAQMHAARNSADAGASTDPALESLSAGQKILLRAGPVNQRRLKAKLAAIRQELLKRVTPR